MALGDGGLDELAGDLEFELTDQVGHEHEAVVEDADGCKGATGVLVGDLAGHVLNATLDLLGGKDDAGLGK